LTRFVLDIASYQGSLTLADVVRAGFTGVNLKVSHGLTQTSVHPNVQSWARNARGAGLTVSTFHWLNASASGAEQAAYAFDSLAALGLTTRAAHVVDCEANAPEQTLRAYVAEMTGLLGRPIAIYTGDWWWKPRGWDGAGLSPYLWGAPNSGYLPAYPSDSSEHWRTGWGGWPEFAALQYAVGPLTFPDGTVGLINVSKSAIRDNGIWAVLTEGSTMATQAYRDWVEDGSPWKYGRAVRAVGDKLKAHGYTVYFNGNDTHLKHDPPEDHTPFAATGWPSKSPYPYCLAMDIMPPAAGQKSKLTGQELPSLQKLAVQLRQDKIAGHPGASWLKYLNWEPEGDGGPCYHDSWMPSYARRASTDRGHIHASSRSDFATSDAGDDYDLVARVTGDDEDMTFEADQVPVKYPAQSPTNPTWTGPLALGHARDLAHQTRDEVQHLRGDLSSLKMQITTLGSSLLAAISALAAKDTVDEAALARELAEGVAAAVVARLPQDRDDVSQEEITSAVEAAFRGAFSGKA
jgi:hypothetical protein